MSKNIYKNINLKYPISDKEYRNFNKVWNLINIYNKPFVSITDKRNYLIKNIRKNYTLDEFYLLENIIDKLFWNLRWIIFPLFIRKKISKSEYDLIINKNCNKSCKEIPNELLLCEKVKYTDDSDLNIKIKDIYLNNYTYYRSFINKILIIDNENKLVYHKKMEGSSTLFSKNLFNLYTMTVLLNRNSYEKVMEDPFNYQKLDIELPHYYYQYDYGFPNLNYCAFNIGNKDYKLNRIRKMYYSKNAEYWYKIIH